MKKITIAIDGFSSCGKSTMAKDLARAVGYIYIDSGAMYRAVTLYSLRKGYFTPEGIDTEALEKDMPAIDISFRLDPETHLPQTCLNGENVEREIRGMEVSSHVSPIAALGFVRRALVRLQQAQRRYDELKAKGQPASYEDILKNVQERDYIDQHREVSPLRKADDALLLDNSLLTIEEQKAWLLEQFKRVTEG